MPTDELSDLDVAVIKALSTRYALCGAAAFDEAASRLVVCIKRAPSLVGQDAYLSLCI